ncbi:MAG: LytR C-terminal domain-containing protein [Acidobacteriota bacterium]|nr:LytR C-terminal domain-containing protein [Acidobacteriota bacterium]MDE3044536.1 LytR C-terminal domain-containing protein [Acidobacteriota bacterium]
MMLVLVALLVVGAYAMLRAHSPASATSNTTTSVSAGATTTTSPRTVVKSQVRVQVANGTLVTGLAGTYTHQLLTEGWDVLPATNALGGHPAATEIFYTPGFKKAAQMVASSIQISPSAVQALSGQNVVAGENSDDVIVILGPDAATK